MTKPPTRSESPTARREFLGQMAASAIVLAGTACASPAAAIQGAPSPATGGSASTAWDGSWFDRLTAKHKAVFDSPEPVEGTIGGFGLATRYMAGMRDALGAVPGDIQTVVVIRHKAIPFAFNDAMWAKYGIGELAGIKEGDKWATRNPISGSRQSPSRGTPAADRPLPNAAWFSANGQIILGCNLATQAYAGTIAGKAKGDSKAIYEELRANLVSGLILQPNGVYAVHRAQEAGCTFMRAT